MIEHPVTPQELARLHAAWELAPESRSFAPLADAYHRAGRHEEAIELLQSGTMRHPDYLSALVLLAECYQSLQRTEEADALYARVLAQDDENLCALEHQAARSIQQGALGNAATLVEKLRQIDPWDANIRRLTAQLQRTPAPPTVDPPRPLEPLAPPVQPSPAGAGTPAAANVAAPGSSADQLSTLTLAQIYESQGYLQKALTIYERLLQQHPGNAQVAQRLDELRRRLTGVDETAYRAASDDMPPLEPQTSEPGIGSPASAPSVEHWRLVDEKSLDALRPSSQAPRWSARGAAPSASDAAADAAASRDEDFQRFLRYVRSLER